MHFDFFLLFEKIEQSNCIKICVKNEFKSARNSAEQEFNCGLTGLGKTEKMSTAMVVLMACARQQPKTTLKQGRK